MNSVERPIVVRSSIRFQHPGHDKARTAVVLAVQDENLIAIYGRGTLLDRDHVKVKHPSRYADAIGLNKVTYFYGTSIVRVRRVQVSSVGHCPPGPWEEIQPFALKHLREMRSIVCQPPAL